MTSEIDKLTTAILDSDITTVRQLVTANPLITWTKTKNDQFPIELAKAKGLKRIETILLLHSDNNKSFYSDLELKNFIGQLISELSEEIYCAGWLEGIEKKLWRLGNDTNLTSLDKDVRVDKEEIKELIALANKLNYWAIWDDNYKPDNIRPIKLTDWEKRFGE
jgi:hypothetical protein